MKGVALAIVIAVAGCSGFINKQAADSTYRILSKSNESAKRQADVQLARDALPGGIMQLASFALAYPDHRGFKQMHREALCQYTVAFIFDDWEDAQLGGRTAQAAKIAERVQRLLGMCVDANLALAPGEWRAARTEGGPAWNAVIAKATKAQLPELVWIATTDAVKLALSPLANLARLPQITAALENSISLQPGFHDSDAEMLLGSLEAGRSQFLGGPDGSARFEAARQQLGVGSLLVDVMIARSVAVARKDRAMFEAHLRRVLDTDLTQWPDKRLANEIARSKAQRYLGAIDVLIPPTTN